MPVPAFNPKPSLTNPRLFDGDRSARFSGSRWQRIRRQWLMQNPACAKCGLAGEEVHHVIERCKAPDRWDDWTNLQTLCKACHRITHGR